MSVTRRTRDALELQAEDGGYLYILRYPNGRVSFGDSGADFGHDDLLVLLSWLADALGVERYVPPPSETCASVNGWSETACLLAPGHGGPHEGRGSWWPRVEAT